MQGRRDGLLFQSSFALPLLLGLLFSALPSCGGSDVPRVGAGDVPCAPYGENRYAGEFSFENVELRLSVSSAAGQCCVLVGSTLAYRVVDLGSTSMIVVDETGMESVWVRKEGNSPSIHGLWVSGDGQTLAFDPSGSFSGSDHPSCFEPPSCGSPRAAARPQQALLAFLPWLAPLAWLWLVGRRLRSR